MERGPQDNLSPEKIQDGLAAGWTFNAAENRIEKTFEKQDFKDGVQFIQRIAALAEANDHHPDLSLTKYKYVTVMLSTHSAGGITLNDLNLAAEIEQLS